MSTFEHFCVPKNWKQNLRKSLASRTTKLINYDQILPFSRRSNILATIDLHFLYINDWTRRYPWGIQRLVSIHQLPHKSRGGGGELWTNSNPKSLNLIKFSFGGGGVLWTNSNPKFPNLVKFSFGGYSWPTQTWSHHQIFISAGGGGGGGGG